MRRSVCLLALTALILIPLPACGPEHRGSWLGAPDPLAGMPPSSTPSGTVRALEWCWNQRSTAGYPLLFTSDYVFAFAAIDTAGNRYNDLPFTRADELASFDAIAAAMNSIDLHFDRSFAIFDDPRPGLDARVHKTIRTQVLLNATQSDAEQYNIQGKANFFLVRGDSAQLPPGVAGHDSLHWFVTRWEDETLVGSLAAAALRPRDPARVGADAPTPTTNKTWGSLKAMFR